MKVLTTVVSSNINEVIKAVLNFFFLYEKISQQQKSTKRKQANKNKKNAPKKHLRGK